MFLRKKTKICLFLSGLFIVLIFFGYNGISTAQTAGNPVSAKEEELKKELENIEKEIVILKSTQADLKVESASIERDISILNAKIKEAQLNIKAKNIKISGLSKDISVKSKDIDNLERKIEKGKDSIGDLLRKSYQIDDTSLITMALSDNDLSQFFIDIDSFDSIKRSLQITLDDVRETKDETEKQKESLSARKDQETDAKVAIESDKRKVEKNEGEKKKLLSLNKEQEKAYKEILKEREKKAAQIRTALFALRDSAAIPFGKALEYANLAAAKTGVKPAFLLAILQQESNLGKNVGTCNSAQDTKKWLDIMPGPTEYQVYLQNKKSCKKAKIACSSRDDQTAFIDIMAGLGRSADNTPLSCPISSAGPWGGAMGPAQFIPSTWQLFKERIASIVGKPVPDPWEPKDAIIASALYLSDLGADGGSYSAQKKAACKYYGSGGSSCYYGNQVMAKAQNIQETMIDVLQGS